MADAGLFLACYIAMLATAAGVHQYLIKEKPSMKLFTNWRFWTIIVALVIGVTVGTVATGEASAAAVNPRCTGKAFILCGTPKPPPAPPAPARKAPIYKAPLHASK